MTPIGHNRIFRALKALSAVSAVVGLLAGCGDDASGPSSVTATVQVSPSQATLTQLGGTQQLSFVVKDAQGVVLTGKTATWISAASGVASVNASGLVTAVANGSATITATVDGKSGQATITVAQQATQLRATRSGAATPMAGEAFAVLVEALDGGGAPVTSFTGSVSVALAPNAGSASLTGSTTLTATGGQAQFPGLSVIKAGAGYAVVASSGSLVSIPTGTFDVVSGPLAELVFVTQPPASVEGNVVIAPRVVVEQRDAYDNVILGGSVTLQLTNAPWARTRLLGTLSVAAPSGIASFEDLRVDRPGADYRLEATSGSVTGQSSLFSVVVTLTSVSVGGRNQQGSGFSCATALGGIFCWGVNNASQLGSPRAASAEPVPFLVDAPAPFVEITTGVNHACGRTDPGEVWCWGDGANGKLGDGSSQNSNVPVRVSGSGPGGLVFTAIDAGEQHTCGLVGAEVFCWGQNLYGQLGDGTFNGQSVPVKVVGSGNAPLDFSQVSAGATYTCGVTASNAAWCWGGAFSGVLGDGQQNTHQSSPVQVVGSGIAPLSFKSISASAARTCAVTVGLNPDTIYCWGSNSGGFLGIGGIVGPTDVLVPTAVAAPGVNFRLVSVGYNTTCGVDTAGAAWCWGRGVSGEIGNGGLANQVSPTAVTLPGSGFARISFGGVHGCAVRTGAGGLYCWGAGDSGALGDGTGIMRTVPTRVVQ